MVGENFENAPFLMGNRCCRSVLFYCKCNDTLRSVFLQKNRRSCEKTSFLALFGVFLGFEHSCSTRPGKLCEKCYKQQLQGSRKPARGMKGSIMAFGCDKNADLVPKNCKKVENWPKRHPKTQVYLRVEP